MKILIVNNGSIPALKYGGTERVIWCLGKELSKMGHQVTYLVGQGSYCDFAKVLIINPEQSIESQIPDDVDVVHLNTFPANEMKKPYIVTIHGNSATSITEKNIVFVSRNHALRYGCDSYVYNGLDWDEYGEVNLAKPRSGYHFLGKAAWRVKNVKGAISVVKALSKEHLDVLGGYRFNFKMGIRFTFSPKIRFKGMVNDVTKKQVIEQSKGLLFPVTWNEPFGLAITESLYLGAPVFGTPYGSLPELVPSEVGFLTNNEQELIHHLQNAHYSPSVCHEYARDCFNSRIMAENYLKKYETVLNGQTLVDHFGHQDPGSRRLIWTK